MLDLRVQNGSVVLQDGRFPLDIGVVQGKIVLLGQPGTLPESESTIDASDLLVLPGIIDSHVHCRAPANPEREDFASGTRGAAAGGVTTVIEMPISVPPTTDGSSFAIRREHAERDAFVDFGFYSSSATLDAEKIAGSVAAGAVAFKAFLQEIPPGREDEFTGLCIHDNGDILRALELVSETGLVAAFHAEDYETLTYLDARLHAAGRTDGPAHWESRPAFVEAIAINTLILLAEAAGARVHFPHVSSRRSVEAIRYAKQRGVAVTAETCPQYLAFDRDALSEYGPYAKCNPPFKTRDDIDGVWEGLRDGTIDTIASDHSPFTVKEKEAGWSDIWVAPPGFPGVENLTTFVMSAALDNKLPLERAVALITANPADIFGLSPQKGRLIPGGDADITLYNPHETSTVNISSWQSRSREIARIWDGLPLIGSVDTTILRGKTIYTNGQITGVPGYGTLVRP